MLNELFDSLLDLKGDLKLQFKTSVVLEIKHNKAKNACLP